MWFVLLKGCCNTSTAHSPAYHPSSARGAGEGGGSGGNGVATTQNPSPGPVPAGKQISGSLHILTILEVDAGYARSGGVHQGRGASL